MENTPLNNWNNESNFLTTVIIIKVVEADSRMRSNESDRKNYKAVWSCCVATSVTQKSVTIAV